MKRGILLNLLALSLLILLIFLPALIMAAAGLAGQALGCEMSGASPGGPPPCPTLIAILVVTGYSMIAIVPITVGLLGLYLLGVLVYFVASFIRSRMSGGPVSPTATGMLISTLAVGLGGACLAIVISGVVWLQNSYVPACESLPGAPEISGVQNGSLAYGAWLPGEPVGSQPYVILSVPPQGGSAELLSNMIRSKDPAWSPDGSQLAFAAETPHTLNRWGLYRANAAGQERSALYEDSLPLARPDWRPDGRQMLFNRLGDTDPNTSQEIFALDLEQGTLQQLSNSPDFDGEARYSPDGSQIVFVSERAGNPDIYLMNANGSNVRSLTHHPAREINPSWSPDGRWIVFASSRESPRSGKLEYDLYTMAPDGSNQCRLTQTAGVEWAPVWSPDGQWIAYIKLDELKVYLVRPDGTEITPVEIDQPLANLLNIDWAPAAP